MLFPMRTTRPKPRQLTCPACRKPIWTDHWPYGKGNKPCPLCHAPLELLKDDRLINHSGHRVGKWQCPICYSQYEEKQIGIDNTGFGCSCEAELRPKQDGFLEVVKYPRWHPKYGKKDTPTKTRTPAQETGYARRKRARDRAKQLER